MLQKDFIDKLLSAAGGKKYNAQSVAFQTFFQARRCFNVSAGAFIPAPKIISTVLAVHPANSPLQEQGDEFYHFARLCFSERRKTLWNNLAPYFDKKILSVAFAACAFSDRRAPNNCRRKVCFMLHGLEKNGGHAKNEPAQPGPGRRLAELAGRRPPCGGERIQAAVQRLVLAK